jgi:NAD(P)-dependent dehydrogenase (short-subunit alcohol dehydrogenase family)
MKDKTFFVTGGNDGIGLATALQFARQGANVALMSRRADKNKEARDQVLETGARCIAITGDVTSDADLEGAIAETVETFGGLHYAFNNAGVFAALTPTPAMTEPDFDSVIAVNLKGVWLSMKHQLPAIVNSGGGAIVNTGSLASQSGMPMLAAYVASKHGVAGLTKSVAVEYAKQGVRVNAVCPGGISDTGIYADISANMPDLEAGVTQASPMGRLGLPEEIAGAVFFLCSDAASYITGQLIYADGGFTVQ